MTDRADALLALKRPREALEHLARALAAEPDDPYLHCRAAQAHLELHEPEEALRAARAAVALAPDEEWCHRLGAIALTQLHAHRAGPRRRPEAARLAPELPATQMTLARCSRRDAGDVYACRRMSLLMLLPALFILTFNPLFALAWLGIPLLLEVTRAILLSRLSPPVRAMVRADLRSRRRRP